MTLKKIATIGIAISLAVAAAYFGGVARKPRLQARLRIDSRGASDVHTHFWDLTDKCPILIYTSKEESADYTLFTVWEEKGWIAILSRPDGAQIMLTQDPDLTKVFRSVCQVVENDFPLWLSTERYRFSRGSQAQTASSATTATGVTGVADATQRYQLMEYRHGNIEGMALVDTKLGRTWVLTDLFDAKGKKVRARFQEVGVEELWETADESWDRVQEASGENKTFRLSQHEQLQRVKVLTRPQSIEEAEAKVSREVGPYPP
ncbi:MAG: hypothetical protein HY651_09010 [Acidobacteria bacterium]|nr:hypothetical protein [Acidobacteriota bacterium]